MKPTQQGDAESIVKFLVFAIGLGLVILALAIFGLYTLARSASPTSVIWWAVIATLMIVPLFFFGFYLGKVEARGVLRGFDKSLDRVTGVIGDIVSVRDQSRIAVHNATKMPTAPNFQVTLPGLQAPIITHRQLTGRDDIIDL